MSDVKRKKLGSNIMRELSNIIMVEAKDEFLKSLTLTGIEVTNDFSIAKIYFTSILDLDKNVLEKEANEASGYLRKELAAKIEARHTPELRFIFDESVSYGTRIEQIINEINKK